MSTTSTTEQVKAFEALLGVGFSGRQRGRQAQSRVVEAERYPEAAVYFQQDVLSLKHICKCITAQNVQARVKKGKGIKPECRHD